MHKSFQISTKTQIKKNTYRNDYKFIITYNGLKQISEAGLLLWNTSDDIFLGINVA